VHVRGGALSYDPLDRGVGHPGPGVVNHCLAPPDVAGVGLDPAQFENGPVVDLARSNLLLPPRKGHIHYDPLDIYYFHGVAPISDIQ